MPPLILKSVLGEGEWPA